MFFLHHLPYRTDSEKKKASSNYTVAGLVDCLLIVGDNERAWQQIIGLVVQGGFWVHGNNILHCTKCARAHKMPSF